MFELLIQIMRHAAMRFDDFLPNCQLYDVQEIYQIGIYLHPFNKNCGTKPEVVTTTREQCVASTLVENILLTAPPTFSATDIPSMLS